MVIGKMRKGLLLLSLGITIRLFAVPALVLGQGNGLAGTNPAQSILGQGNAWIGTSLAQMVDTARWRIGGLRINAAFELTNSGYDSDIFYGYYGVAVPDLTLSASLPVQALLSISKKVVLDLYDSPEYVFYYKTAEERAWNNIFRGRIHYASDRLYIQAGGGLSNVRQLLSPEVTVSVRQKEDSFNGTLLWRASRATSLALLYEGLRLDYGEAASGGTDFSQTLNRHEDYVDFIAYLQPSSKLRFFVDLQHGGYVFAESASSYKNTRSYSLFGGVLFAPSERGVRPIDPLQGSISLGYKTFDLVDPLYSDSSGLVGAADVSVGLLRKTSGRAFFSRDFTFSAYSNLTYYLSTVYGAGLSRLLSRHATLSYDLSFIRSDYPEAMSGGVPGGQDTRYTTHSINISLQVARNLEIGFQGIFSRRILEAQGLVTNRNFLGIRIAYGSVPVTISAPVRVTSI